MPVWMKYSSFLSSGLHRCFPSKQDHPHTVRHHRQPPREQRERAREKGGKAWFTSQSLLEAPVGWAGPAALPRVGHAEGASGNRRDGERWWRGWGKGTEQAGLVTEGSYKQSVSFSFKWQMGPLRGASFVAWPVNGTAGDKTQGWDVHPSFSLLLWDQRAGEWVNLGCRMAGLSGRSHRDSHVLPLRLSRRFQGWKCAVTSWWDGAWAQECTGMLSRAIQQGQHKSLWPGAAGEPLQTQNRKGFKPFSWPDLCAEPLPKLAQFEYFLRVCVPVSALGIWLLRYQFLLKQLLPSQLFPLLLT